MASDLEKKKSVCLVNRGAAYIVDYAAIMNYNLAQTICWVSAFIALALMPVVIALTGELPEQRGFWVEFGVLLGFLGLAVLNIQFVITGRFRWFAEGFGLDNLLQFHKQTGIFALLLVLAHPAVLVVADPQYWAFLDPRVNFPRAAALTVVTVGSLVLVASTLWRLTFRLSYEQWRLVHGLLSFGILFLGLAHVLMVGHYSDSTWKKTVFIGMSGGAMYLIVHSRFVRPLAMRRRPYRIAGVRPERNDSWTLLIEPDGHSGLRFRPGQFVWLTVGDTPFSLQQHPFSISSGASWKTIELTIKKLGDFTATVDAIQPGTRAWLEGPYGSFTREGDPGEGVVMIAGGVGITPVMSMLRSAHDAGDELPIILIYGNTSRKTILFRRELDEMQSLPWLTVIHVLEEPPEAWTGETGFIDRGILDRHLPVNFRDCQYFICGPALMIDLVEPALHGKRVPARQIHSERFDMV